MYYGAAYSFGVQLWIFAAEEVAEAAGFQIVVCPVVLSINACMSELCSMDQLYVKWTTG